MPRRVSSSDSGWTEEGDGDSANEREGGTEDQSLADTEPGQHRRRKEKMDRLPLSERKTPDCCFGATKTTDGDKGGR